MKRNADRRRASRTNQTGARGGKITETKKRVKGKSGGVYEVTERRRAGKSGRKGKLLDRKKVYIGAAS